MCTVKSWFGCTVSIQNTFVTVGDKLGVDSTGASVRRTSCPARVRTEKLKQMSTLRVRDLPRRMSPDAFAALIQKTSAGATCEYLYMPVDGYTSLNKGFAFVTVAHQDGVAASLRTEIRTLLGTRGKKVSVGRAVLQGTRTNLVNLEQHAVVMLRVEEQLKGMLVKDALDLTE